jgi:glycosyltransferase involved in cell wall biosynthesis/SAM-dependent methyltransferase
MGLSTDAVIQTDRELVNSGASILRCTECVALLPEKTVNEGSTPVLECSCGKFYPIVAGIPRFVSTEKYSASFGIEWKEFPRTQLDSDNGTQISYYRFKQLAGIEPATLTGKRVLEVGCGMGRFLDVVAKGGGEVWGVDLSLSVEVAAANTAVHANCHIVQADLFNMPFGEDFDFIYSFGVLHHTPDPRAAYLAIARHLRPGGRISVWTYGRGISSGIKSHWIPRPYRIYGSFIKRLSLPVRKRALTLYTHGALAASSVPLLGRAFRHITPIQDLRKRGPRQDGYEPTEVNAGQRERLRFEWARHSAFDMFTPSFTAQHEADELVGWAKAVALTDVRVGEVPVSVQASRPRTWELKSARRNGSGPMADKIKVLFFSSTLGGGGAEKHLLRIINHLDRSRFQVSLALVKPGGEFESALLGDVEKHSLNRSIKGSTTLRLYQSIEPLRRLIRLERPDLIFSLNDLVNLFNVIAVRGLEAPPKIILGVQTPPSIAYRHSWNPIAKLILQLIPRLYPRADRIVSLSRGVATDLVSLSPKIQDRITVIYNAGFEAEVLEKAQAGVSAHELPDGPLIVACGRLKTLKGFSYLIDALVEVRKSTPASLWIIGEGEERGTLENKINKRGLQSCVRLLGFQENPFKYMAAADVFVLSSLFEGFGNVIVEAMACGVPVIATDCPYGPREIISDGKNGILVKPEDASALARAILEVLNDDEMRKRLSVEGKDRANDFNAHTIAAEYEELFVNVVNGSARIRTTTEVAAG